MNHTDRPQTLVGKRGASFRKRLGPALLLAGLVLLAVNLLPALPTDNLIQVRSSEAFSAAQLTYYDEDGVVIQETRQNLGTPSAQVTFRANLAQGTYRLGLILLRPPMQERGVSAESGLRRQEVSRVLELSGGTTVVRVP